MESDIVIVGGGPAGLSLAASLSGNGMAITVIERAALENLAAPAFDGREIALTRRSVRILDELSVWERFSVSEVAPFRRAEVLNGASPVTLAFERGGIEGLLGRLVSNQSIRRELYNAVIARPDVRILAGSEVVAVRSGARRAEVELGDGRLLQCRLVVAADSRMSSVRNMLGIAAQVHQTGRSMLVCRMEHDRDHRRIATEWFDHHQTLALLPLNGRMSSAVITLPSRDTERLVALEPGTFGEEMSRRFGGLLGEMRLVSTRHAYPLTITWSDRFIAQRAALVGDAAVGMHPVTAHGFNLGLLGVHGLARDINRAAARSADIGSARHRAPHREPVAARATRRGQVAGPTLNSRFASPRGVSVPCVAWRDHRGFVGRGAEPAGRWRDRWPRKSRCACQPSRARTTLSLAPPPPQPARPGRDDPCRVCRGNLSRLA